MDNKTASENKTVILPEIRCQYCNRLLFKGRVKWVEIKCPKCRHRQIITYCGVLSCGRIMGGMGKKALNQGSGDK